VPLIIRRDDESPIAVFDVQFGKQHGAACLRCGGNSVDYVNRDGVLHDGFEIVAFADDLRGVHENLYQSYY
jgi:hypothetical protein